jgi:hypothetical protein
VAIGEEEEMRGRETQSNQNPIKFSGPDSTARSRVARSETFDLKSMVGKCVTG